MTLQDILQHRRAVRHYDREKPIETERVKECIRLATLAPSSSNMQLWEAYHIVSPEKLRVLGQACLGQDAATTAQQMVVFVVRPDLAKQRAQAALTHERANVERHSPTEKHASRIKRWEDYYGKIIPFLYARGCGLIGAFRKSMIQVAGLFRPVPRQVSEADMYTIMHKSCALAAQTFMLAMSEADYDTCPLEGFDSLRVKRILGLPRQAQINMIVSCGIRTPQGVWGDRFRIPFEETYHRVDGK